MKALFKRHLVPWLAAQILRLLFASLRLEISGLEHLQQAGPRLFVFWHNRILLTPAIYQYVIKGKKGVALISRSRDGETISQLIGQFGIRASRGSTSKKGSVALRGLVRALQEEGADIAITPDGPRGPRYVIQPGILQLAQMTGYPIIPIIYESTPRKELRSWDRFQIPYPFARCRLRFGSPIFIPTEGDIDRGRKEIADALGE